MIAPRIASFAIAAGSLILILALPGCGDVVGLGGGCLLCGPSDRLEVESVTIVPDSVLLSVGESDSLEVIIVNTDGSSPIVPLARWSSSDTVVATVSGFMASGILVTGRARGEASITAEAGGKIGTAKVIVN